MKKIEREVRGWGEGNGGKRGKCEEYWKEKMGGNWVKSEEKRGKVKGKWRGKEEGKSVE